MTWDMQRALAVAVWPACAGIFVIAACRLNAMPENTRWSVVVEYAVWMAIAWGMALLPLVGEWPGPGLVLLAYALVLVLLCSARAWAGDVAPDEATDHAPLNTLTTRQRLELAWLRLRADVEMSLQRFKAWRMRR